MILERQQSGEIEQRAGRGVSLALLDACHLQAELDILANRQPGEQRVLLEHDAAVRARFGDRLAVEPGLAKRRLDETGDDAEQGRLAATRRPDQRDEFARLYVERHAFDGHDLAVVCAERDAHVANVDEALVGFGLHHCHRHRLLPGANASQGIMRTPTMRMIPLQASPSTPIVIMPSTIAG